MKNDEKKQAQQFGMVDRYVYDVTRRLPAAQRSDIEKELRGLIEDMLASKTGGAIPEKADIEAVLTELGRPSELAAKYRGARRYLIGPDYIDIYWLVVKVVMAATAFGITVAFIVGLIAELPQNVWAAIGQYLLNVVVAAIQAFAWVTVVFAIIERFAKRGSAEKMKEEFRDAWKPVDLPELPAAKTRIGIGESVFGIVITVAVLVFINVAPELIGIYVGTQPVTIIPIFDPGVWHDLIWLINALFFLSVIKEAVRLIFGRYTIRLATVVTVIDILSIVLTITVFLPPAIWNGELIPSLYAAADMTWAKDIDLEYIWSIIPKIIVGLTIFGNGVDIITNWVRGARNMARD